jgi:hypothetical protein
LSAGGLTLAQIVQQLDGYDDESLIWARARTDLADLTPDTEAVVAPELENGGVWWEERGLSYVLEVGWPRRRSRSGGSGVTELSRRPPSAARRSSTTPSHRERDPIHLNKSQSHPLILCLGGRTP